MIRITSTVFVIVCLVLCRVKETIAFNIVGYPNLNHFTSTTTTTPSLSRLFSSPSPTHQPTPHYPQRSRPRRNRKSPAIRNMIKESSLSPANLIYPLFVTNSETNSKVGSMPGVERHTFSSALKEIDESVKLGIHTFAIFPIIETSLKTNLGEESYNPIGLVPNILRSIKAKYPEVVLVTDVALDPYSSMGHDGVVCPETGKILNDITVKQLCKQAICQARAGSDIIAPSDMMDGRVGAIRDALDNEGFTDVSIMSYTAKYASAFYGPFRDAVDSHPGKGDKKTYQQDPANSNEALREAELDEYEGADIMMVKPGLPYLDVIRRLKDNSNLPIAAYHVSGEYCMLKAAVERGWLDEKTSVLETLLCFRRAGADVILTYYAKSAAEWMKEE